jgi:hypothetical protein
LPSNWQKVFLDWIWLEMKLIILPAYGTPFRMAKDAGLGLTLMPEKREHRKFH